MSYFFKNTKRFSILFTALILSITLTAGSFAAVTKGLPADSQQAPEDEYSVIDGDMSFDYEESEPSEPEELPVMQMSFNVPSEMSGVYLVPGTDFIKDANDSADTAKKQADDALEAISKTKLNTVIIDTVYGEKAIYNTSDSAPKYPDFDLTAYITEKCRENGMFVYAIFDASQYDGLEELEANLSEFAEKYALDGILLDGYEGKTDSSDYGEYIKSGGSMGYDNYLNQRAASIAKTASKTIRRAAPDTQAGLLANPVWANTTDRKDGTETKAEYTSLISGFADTKSYIELGWFDFAAVKASVRTKDANAPFGEIASWWSELAERKSIPLYFVYPTVRVGADGWTSSNIQEQMAYAENENAYRGAIFDSAKNIPDSMTVAEAVKPAKAEPSDAASLVKPLAAAAPAQNTPEKKEPAAAPVPVTNNDDEPDEPDEPEPEDYEEEDAPGGDVIKSISPMGTITGEYGEDIEITVMALEDSDVIATLNGESIYLSLDTGYGASASGYARYTGVYTVPESVEDDDYDGEQFLGALSVYAVCGERDEILDGAYFAAAKTSTSRYPVQVVADQARTYPTATRDMVPYPTMYPQPKGAVDYAVGKPVTVRNASGEKFTHLILESGVRIDRDDVKEIKAGPSKNSIKSLSLSNKSGYTYVTLKTDQKVTYTVSYTGKEFVVTFNNTTSVPSSSSLKSNPMFSKATWSGKNRLVLTLAKDGGFMGYKGYYDGDSLVFRFNNPPSSIKNAKIYVDPGHGGSDTGAIGKNPAAYEKDINRAIALKLVAELKARGATVKMYEQSKNLRGPQRVEEAEKWGADILVSVHCNSSSNTAAKGTEVYYFYPFSRQLSVAASLNTSKQLASDNRGAKLSYYNITLSPQMTSALVETGFFTNTSDYKKLRSSSYHQKLAVGMANGIEGAIKSAYTGKASNGTEFKSPGTSSSTDTASSSGGTLTSLSFASDVAQIKIGETMTLKPIYAPSNAKDVEFTWRTGNSSTVSVDENGKITGLKAGTSTITATATDGSKLKATVRVTVTNEVQLPATSAIDVSGMALSSANDAYLDEENTTIYPGNKHRIEIYSDSGKIIRGADFKWKTSKSSVATVDSHGVVTAKAVGTAVINATGGGYSFDCEVEVSKTKVAVKGISLEETRITIARNVPTVLKATVLPKNAADKGIRWSSSNSRIAEVTENGVVIGKNGGKVTITARTKTGNYAATCAVEVLNKAIELEEISTDIEALELSVGGTDAIYVSYYPSNTTTDRSVTFASSNSKIVTVDDAGNIKALAKGTATITVTSKANSKLKATCKVTVL